MMQNDSKHSCCRRPYIRPKQLNNTKREYEYSNGGYRKQRYKNYINSLEYYLKAVSPGNHAAEADAKREKTHRNYYAK